MKECCKNCKFSILVTDIPGLVDCELEGRSKDDDMVCETYQEKPSYKWKDPESN